VEGTTREEVRKDSEVAETREKNNRGNVNFVLDFVCTSRLRHIGKNIFLCHLESIQSIGLLNSACN